MAFDFKSLKDKFAAKAAEAQETFGEVAKKAGAYAEKGIQAAQAADKVVTDYVTDKAKVLQEEIKARLPKQEEAANDEKPAAPAKKAGKGGKAPKA
jgi:hypothetical protein